MALPWPSSRAWLCVPQKSALQEALAVCERMGAFSFLWARASIGMGNMHGLFAPADIHPFQPTSLQHSCEQGRILLPLFPGRGMCWENLLGSCSNNSSLGRARLFEVLEVFNTSNPWGGRRKLGLQEKQWLVAVWLVRLRADTRGVDPKFYLSGGVVVRCPLRYADRTALGRNVWKTPGGSAAACPFCKRSRGCRGIFGNATAIDTPTLADWLHEDTPCPDITVPQQHGLRAWD